MTGRFREAVRQRRRAEAMRAMQRSWGAPTEAAFERPQRAALRAVNRTGSVLDEGEFARMKTTHAERHAQRG